MREIQVKTAELFEPNHSLAWPYLAQTIYPWEILPNLKNIIREIGATLDPQLYDNPSEGVWIAKSAKIAPTALIGAPAIIGEETEVRHGAFIRGSALVGNHCVVGNSVELKNCILSDNVQVPHFNYVGDAVLGYKSHMGAGSVTSNVKSDRSLICVRGEGVCIETGLKKMGAMLGDHVEVGCNAVLNPGCVVGQHTSVYPTASVRGVIPAYCILKAGRDVEISERQ